MGVRGESILFSLAVAAAGIALLWAFVRARQLGRHTAGTEAMMAVAGAIQEGAQAFLLRAYRTMALFIALLAAGILLADRLGYPGLTAGTALAFVFGAACSLAAGYAGMRVAVRANVRTAAAARSSLGAAFGIAFDGGSVMGFTVAGLGLAGVAAVLFAFGRIDHPATLLTVNGFALGASSVALFARVGGGIYTKGADIGADLVGKVEEGIPEDDPRNPAVIADNVGDNVGDVAGMGADLFESYVGSLVAAVAIGAATPGFEGEGLLLPLGLAGVGILGSLLGAVIVHAGGGRSPGQSLQRATLWAGMFCAAGAWGLTAGLYHQPRLFGSVVVGLAIALVIGGLTERATGSSGRAVRRLADMAVTGPATAVIEGLALGMGSVILPMSVIALGTLAAYAFGGLYGIAMAAVGMLSTTAITLTVDAYGPIADNAGGIAEMAGLDPEVRARTDLLDALGNTTAAVGKGIAIGSAAMTALALFAAYAERAHLEVVDLLHPAVTAGLLAGGALPFLFSAFSLRAVGRAAQQIVNEVRRQFRDERLRQGKIRPDYARCVDISTKTALREMLLPGTMAVVLPVVVGMTFGRATLGGMLAGSLASGVALAIQMSNSGGAMDNAKKLIEGGAHGGKGQPAHAAAVVADTVGDPLKDTAGPSLNILLKLMSIVALVFVPLFR